VVVGRLPDLVAEHSLVEPPAAALMKALHMGGGGPEALACFTALRERPAEELGADPGTEVKRLHQAILRGEGSGRTCDPAVPAAAGTHPEARDLRSRRLVGRAEETAMFDRVLDEVTAGGTGTRARGDACTNRLIRSRCSRS